MENSITTTATANPNYYITSDGLVAINGTANWGSQGVSFGVTKKSGIAPELYFKYVKKKLSFLEKRKLDSRLKKLEKAFDKAVEAGQEVLAEKFLNEVAREARESVIYTKGVKMFIERDDLFKHKRNIRDGHISDTLLKNYTRVIPKSVLEKKKKVESAFDDFVIFHYYNSELEEKREKKQKMSESEKSAMRDPILFGIIKETNRLYFVDDWEDEFCDLTFDEIVDVVGLDEEEITLTREPKLGVN
jgi:hypothetical protein